MLLRCQNLNLKRTSCQIVEDSGGYKCELFQSTTVAEPGSDFHEDRNFTLFTLAGLGVLLNVSSQTMSLLCGESGGTYEAVKILRKHELSVQGLRYVLWARRKAINSSDGGCPVGFA
jgi:hypothetical protein